MAPTLRERSSLQVATDLDFEVVSQPHSAVDGGPPAEVEALLPRPLSEAVVGEMDHLRAAYAQMAAKYRAMPGTPDRTGGAPPDAPAT